MSQATAFKQHFKQQAALANVSQRSLLIILTLISYFSKCKNNEVLAMVIPPKY